MTKRATCAILRRSLTERTIEMNDGYKFIDVSDIAWDILQVGNYALYEISPERDFESLIEDTLTLTEVEDCGGVIAIEVNDACTIAQKFI